MLRTADGAATSGSLYRPPAPARHRGVRDASARVHGLSLPDSRYRRGRLRGLVGSRSVGNDLRLEHETALLDVAAGLAYLRGQGFKRIVLLGNSRRRGALCLLRAPVGLPAAERIARTPGGKRSGLNELDMPTVDGMVLIGPHPGQGALLLNCIDPSVADENDALSVAPELDPLAPANGYQPGGRARYAPAFVERYRERSASAWRAWTSRRGG